MTTSAASLQQLTSLIKCLSDQGWVLDANAVMRETAGMHRLRVCWDRKGKGSVIDQDASVASYFSILKDRDYAVLLADRGILQISMEFKRDEMTKHRYCYYPCPLVVPPADEWYVESEGLEGYMNMLSLAQLSQQMRLGGAMRIDFDMDAAKPGHSACHLTLFGNAPSCQDSRIPVFGPLSVGHFAAFFFRHYYKNWWEASSQLRDHAPEWRKRTMSDAERFEFHIEWIRAASMDRP